MSFWQRKGTDDANHGQGQKSPQDFKNDTARKEYQASYNVQKAANQNNGQKK